MTDNQRMTLEKFAAHIKNTNPVAIGVAYMVLDCGCLQGGPFDEHGDQAGPIEHFLVQASGETIKICQPCMDDGGKADRVAASGLLFFSPEELEDVEKQWLCNKIFCESHP
jgi:hypothetical protein